MEQVLESQTKAVAAVQDAIGILTDLKTEKDA
jgi:hypothetical protein